MNFTTPSSIKTKIVDGCRWLICSSKHKFKLAYLCLPTGLTKNREATRPILARKSSIILYHAAVGEISPMNILLEVIIISNALALSSHISIIDSLAGVTGEV